MEVTRQADDVHFIRGSITSKMAHKTVAKKNLQIWSSKRLTVRNQVLKHYCEAIVSNVIFKKNKITHV